MADNPIDDQTLEQVYDAMAEAIDQVGPENERVFLAKLAFTLAARIGDAGAVRTAIAMAEQDLTE